MAILRILNELGRESVVLALEPARQCICGCTYCFAELNSRIQYKGRRKNYEDDGSFERTVEKAMSPSYDPQDFRQWGIRNRLVLTYSNGCEPWQDIPQAKAILSICDTLSIPLFFQSKGLNFCDVFDHLRPFHDNATMLISFPTEDDRVLRRFEPGTPLAAERIRVIEAAARAGFHVILAFSPYHEDWNADPAGMVRRAKDWGVSSVFFDFLTLNDRHRQAATDKVMVSLARTTKGVNKIDRGLGHFELIWRACDELDLPFCSNGFIGGQLGLHDTMASINPQGVFKRGFQWPYHDGILYLNLHDEFDQDIDTENRDFNDSILITWNDVISFMEMSSYVDQEFSWSSLSELFCFKNLAPAWKSLLKPTATIAEYYRALWNSPTQDHFIWWHPWARVAMQPDGTQWLDDAGNLILLFDPDWKKKGQLRIADDLSVFRTLLDAEDSEEPIDETVES